MVLLTNSTQMWLRRLAAMAWIEGRQICRQSGEFDEWPLAEAGEAFLCVRRLVSCDDPNISSSTRSEEGADMRAQQQQQSGGGKEQRKHCGRVHVSVDHYM